jgi:hypothetical protein
MHSGMFEVQLAVAELKFLGPRQGWPKLLAVKNFGAPTPTFLPHPSSLTQVSHPISPLAHKHVANNALDDESLACTL